MVARASCSLTQLLSANDQYFHTSTEIPEARLCLDTMLSIARASIRISFGPCLGLSKCHTTGYKVGHQVNWSVRRPFIACVLYNSLLLDAPGN